jgi:hypothetical protein
LTACTQGERSNVLEVGIAPEVLRQLAEAEAARGPDPGDAADVKELEKQMVSAVGLPENKSV